MSKPVIPTARLADCCLVRFMEPTCLSNKQRFLQYGTSDSTTFSSECHLVTKSLLWLDGGRVKEPSAIWANGTHIQKTILNLLVSIDRNGTTYQRSVETSGQCLLSSSGENLYMPSWSQNQAEVPYLPLWNSGQ